MQNSLPNDDLVTKLSKIWHQKAAVKGSEFVFHPTVEEFSKPEYPIELVPFWKHPDFEKVSDETKSLVLSYAWVGYNQRTITAEERVANPGFEYLLNGVVPGMDQFHYRCLIRQSLIDEHFHSLMHSYAIEATVKRRGLDPTLRLPNSITYRTLERVLSEISDDWEKKFITTIFAIVSEISINTFLDLVALNKDVPSNHAKLAELHARDEYAHSLLLEEGVLYVYECLNEKQKDDFRKFLPIALTCFMAQDYSMWEAILNQAKVSKIDAILGDSKKSPSGTSLTRDYSALKKMCDRTGITRKIDFDFGVA